MSALRIGWAAPWNTSSAIAHSASRVAFELAERGHSVTVLRTEVGPTLDLPARAAPGLIRSLSEYQTHELVRDFDVLVGHFGDHFAFHGQLLPRLSELDLVGIFHDAAVPHLFSGWAVSDEKTAGDFHGFMRGLVRECYGDALAEGTLLWNDLADVASRYPLVEWIARRTVGAIAHANHYAWRLQRACPGPVAVIPLAYPVENVPMPPPAWSRTVIAIVGHANPNKRIDQVILAVSSSYILRERCRIRVIGEAVISEREKLTALALRLGVVPPEFTGWVSDEELLSKLRDVDVIACLRKPVIEGASASVVLALMSKRPTLVNHHGCYAEIPSDAALHCSPDQEALDIMLHLEHVVREPAFGMSTGLKGQEFAAVRHSAKAYVDALEPFLEKVVVLRPVAQARREIARTCAEFGLSSDDPAVDRIKTILDSMIQDTP